MQYPIRPIVLAGLLLSSILSPAQEIDQELAPLTQAEDEQAPDQLENRALAGPRLLDRLPDGTPPPPVKPKPPFLAPPNSASEANVYQEGGRNITISRIAPVALPPPPVPDAPPTDEQLAAWKAARESFAARVKTETFLCLGATVYLMENLPPRSYVTVWGNGRKPASFWSNADFRLISGIGRFARGDGSTCRIMMTWCPIRPELARNAALSNNRPWKLPEFPVFPGELADSLTGANATPASACFIPKDPAAFQELDEKTISALRDLHELYNREHPRLLTAWQDRERARLAREAELKANPPKPKDIVIHHFDLGEGRPVPPAPQPAVPPAPRPVRQPRSRRNRMPARRIAPASKDRSLLLTCLLAVSSLAVIPAATSMIDTNGNQISDIYERAWNNGQLLPPEHAPESDADGDGWTLAKEAAAGTNPLPGGAAPNYQQVFIEHVPPVYGDLDQDGIEEIVSPETQLIYWPTLSGKLYQLETTPTLAADSWLPVGSPRIGTGADMGSGVPITQPDGGTPDRMFFRVAVTDIDEDGDGLESAEEALLGTHPLKRDTDSDGVTDREEIAINLTNPLLAADADQDGMPDDFEKHLARQLLGLHPEPGYWGAQEAGLLAGNLDPAHDYTGDGMGIGGMQPLMVSAAAGARVDTDYQVESQERHNGMLAYTDSNPGGWGSYWFSRPGDYDSSRYVNDPQEMVSTTLVNELAALSFGPYTTPEVVDWKPEHAYYWSWTAAGFITEQLPGDMTRYQGYIHDRKFRVISRNLEHPHLRCTFIKVKSKNAMWDHGLGEVISAEPFVIDLPAGRIATDWIRFEPEMIDGQATVIGLVPVEFEVKHTEKERDADGNETQTVVNPGSDTMLRDEIVDILIKVPPIGTTDWTIDLTVEPEAMRSQNLPGRGDMKMYDFGQVETSGTVIPDKTQFLLQASAGGERTIRAVFNKEGKLKIKMKSTDGKIDFTSSEYTIKERVRKYAVPYPGFPSHDPNKYDQQFVEGAKHWGDFYSHPIDTVDRLKAISVAESNVGAYVQNKTLRPHDILTIGHPDDNVLETIQGEPKQWDLDLAHPKKPAADARYKKLNYPEANIGSTREAIKWGALWLFVKAFAQTPPSSSGISHRTTKANPDWTYEKRNQAPLEVIDGTEEPERQFVDWHTWDDATKLYNGGGDSANPTKIEHAFRKGQHYYNGTTNPLWPIRSDKSGRP